MSTNVDYNKLLTLGRELLVAIGEDPERDGLKDTPRRYADWWREFIEYHPGNTETCFESVSSNQMVVVSGMRVWSLCEHHLLPFSSDVSIAYIAREKVLGLSKFARIAHKYAHSLQLQERLGQQITDEIIQIAETEDVAVIVSGGDHLCMTMRGIRTRGNMTSMTFRGAFETSHEMQQTVLRLALH